MAKASATNVIKENLSMDLSVLCAVLERMANQIWQRKIALPLSQLAPPARKERIRRQKGLSTPLIATSANLENFPPILAT